MVGFFTHRRFASERSPHQEHRLLRFAKTGETGSEGGGMEQMPAGANPDILKQLEALTGGTRGAVQQNIRAMASADSGGHGGGHDGHEEGGHDGGHEGGDDHGGHGEHGHEQGPTLRASTVLHDIEHKEHELHDMLHKFDDENLQNQLQKEEFGTWSTSRNFVNTLGDMLRDAKEEIAVLAKWEKGELDPEDFLVWMLESKPEPAMNQQQRLEAEKHIYEAQKTDIDKEIHTIEGQLQGQRFGPPAVLAQLDALKKQRSQIWKQYEKNVKQIRYEKPLLVEDPSAPATSGDAKDFESLRSDAVVELRSLIQKWRTANYSDRVQMAAEAMAIPAIFAFVQKKLRRAKAGIERINNALEQGTGDDGIGPVKPILTEVEGRGGGQGGNKEVKYDPHMESHGGGITHLYKEFQHATGLKLYSIKGIMEGFHLWYEAYHGALHKFHHREGSMLAHFMGKATAKLPFGTDVEIELEANDDKANDEVKDTYKEILTKRNVNFRALIEGPESELSRNIKDYNRTRAILEYAASRGWLYDLDQGSTDHFFGRHIHDLVPHEWDHNRVKNYISKLTTEQNQGKKAEQEKYHQRYFNVNSTDVFVKLMEEELDKVNMWGAMGILQRSLERGLWGHVAPWHSVVLIRAIQKNPLLQRYMTIDVLDQFGNKSLYNSYGRWSGNVTKLTRKQWYKAIQESLRSGTPLDLKNVKDDEGKTMQGVDVFLRAEKEIEKLYGPYRNLDATLKKKFDEDLALFISGGIIERNNKKVSIFSSKFDDWTTKDVGQGQIKIGDEDEDYFRNGMYHQPAETTTTADEVVFTQIFEVTGNGQFEHETRAKFTADSIITMLEDFEEKGMKAEKNKYSSILRRKLRSWFNRYVSDARASAAAFQKMLRPHYKSDVRTPYVVLEFVRNHLLDLDVIAGSLDLPGFQLAANILAQCEKYQDKLDPELRSKLNGILSSLSPEHKKKVDSARGLVRTEGAGGSAAPAGGHH